MLSIIASPTLSSDVRHKASSLLRQVHTAYSSDKAKSQAQAGVTAASTGATISPLSDSEAKELEQEIESGKIDDKVEHTPIKTDHVLRVHGVYMSERRHFEIRTGSDGKLELWDAKTKEKW